MMASLFAGVSGLKNHQVKMNVIGNNIANINTIGFKASRVNFQEALVQTFKGAGRPSSISGGTNPIQLGLGMQVGAVDNLFQQGGLETTGQITDLAIQGQGFFVLGDSNDNKFYTRAGAFGFDSESRLVDPATGLFVLGKMADSSGVIPSLATVDQIRLPFGQQDPARATEVINLSNNLDVSATNSDATLVSAGSSNVLSVSGRALDGVGGTHIITIAGAQAQNASFTSGAAGFGAGTTLGVAGVTVFNDFSLTIDSSRTENITGLSATSTIGDLINSINQIEGLAAQLTAGGAIEIIRGRAGDPLLYGFQSSDAAAGNITNIIFGVPAGPGNTFVSAGGAASTLTASDTFTPDRGSGPAIGPVVQSLPLIFDDTSGLAVGISGIDSGGIEVTTGTGGLAATAVGSELVIQTEPTTHSTSLQVFDSQGGKHTVSLEFFKSIVPNRWEWTASVLGGESIASGNSGYVSFNSDGSLNTFDYAGGASAITIDPQNGAANIVVAIDAGSPNGFDGITGFASGRHTASFIAQDGYGLGILEKISIDQSGNISGIFSNGVNRVLAQVILADFNNQAGLRKAGRSMFQTSANSGEAVEGIAGATVSGQISSGALESSAVDIAQEFTQMITAQRGFQANARIITTSDTMLDELVNIKR
jgi:flagellar hook protein FlgE